MDHSTASVHTPTPRKRALELAFANPTGFWFSVCPQRPRAVTLFSLISPALRAGCEKARQA